MDNLGVSAAVVLLSEDDYATYKNNYGPGKGCAASFLNSHAVPLLLVPDNPGIQAILRRESADEGDLVEIEGDVLEFSQYLVKGTAIQASISFGNTAPFRPRRLSLRGTLLYMR
jgi:hypothetical protein